MADPADHALLKLDDVYAWNLLRPLLDGYPYLPFSGSALRPLCLAHLINDVVVNRRRSILEFGAGISSIVVGRLIRRNRLRARLTSIEHDADWTSTMAGLLAHEGLDSVVKVVHAPLAACALAVDGNTWYRLDVLRQALRGKRFDLVLVDGPPAWEAGKGRARQPALPFVRERLADRFAVYLDDANRPGERAILKAWSRSFQLAFRVTGGSLAVATRGAAFYTEPFAY